MVVKTRRSPLYQLADRLFAPLVQEGVFSSTEDVMRTVLLDYIDRQIATHQAEVSAFETRHKLTLAEFSKKLRGQATLEQEDEWLDWEEATRFLRKWQRLRERVANVASHPSLA